MTKTLLNSGSIEAYLIEEDNQKYFQKVVVNPNTRDVQQIETEIIALQNLDHPSIPKLISYSLNGKVEIVREYKDGKALSEFLSTGTVFGREEVVDIALKSLDALGYLHNKGILHRDVKPSNLIYDQNKDLFLVDLGIAKLRYFSGTTTTTVGGSFPYMAPEQYNGKSSPSSDIYSLGATLIELLTGKTIDNYIRGNSI